MSEDFLHYVWKFQLYNFKNLRSKDGDSIRVLDPGTHNFNSGPDFLNAQILIGSLMWWGSVEIHLNSTDWNAHKHQNDPSYNNVVLHVVWKGHKSGLVKRKDGSEIPTLELHPLVQKLDTLKNYHSAHQEQQIVCGKFIANITEATLESTITEVVLHRLQKRVYTILKPEGSWEEMIVRRLFTVFGSPVNTSNFLDLYELVYHQIGLHNLQCSRKSSYFVGDLLVLAGFESTGDSPKFERTLHAHQWNYGRLRPSSFPKRRILQLAVVLSNIQQLKDLIVSYTSVIKIEQTIQNWFSKEDQIKCPGKGFLHHLIINGIVPLLCTHQHLFETENRSGVGNAIRMLKNLPPEQNNVIRQWQKLGLNPKNAFQSQGLLALYKQNCSLKRCLFCNIGVEVLQL